MRISQMLGQIEDLRKQLSSAQTQSTATNSNSEVDAQRATVQSLLANAQRLEAAAKTKKGEVTALSASNGSAAVIDPNNPPYLYPEMTKEDSECSLRIVSLVVLVILISFNFF